MLWKDVTRTDGSWIKRLMKCNTPSDMSNLLDDYEKEMNSKDFIEEKKRTYLKTEACDWDCHDYCERVIEIGSRTSPCLCTCHKLAHSNGEMPVSQDLYNVLYPRANAIITDIRVPKEYDPEES